MVDRLSWRREGILNGRAFFRRKGGRSFGQLVWQVRLLSHLERSLLAGGPVDLEVDNVPCDWVGGSRVAEAVLLGM